MRVPSGRTCSVHPNIQKEEFSIAYVRAVAAVAGFSVSDQERAVDDDGIDISIKSSGAKGTSRRPSVDVQLKCTAIKMPDVDPIPYRLRVKNYDDLRKDVITPRILVVLFVPSDNPDEWLDQSIERMILSRCAFWVSLKGSAESTSTKDSKQTNHLPREQQFTEEQLVSIMLKAQDGVS